MAIFGYCMKYNKKKMKMRKDTFIKEKQGFYSYTLHTSSSN